MSRRTLRGAIAQRHGRPAYENAPQRLRASQLERRFIPEGEQPRPGIFARLIGKVLP